MIEEFNRCECGNEKPINELLCLHCWTLENNFSCECQQSNDENISIKPHVNEEKLQ